MPQFPNPVNEILIDAEKEYSTFLKETGLPDHPAVKLAYYYAMLEAVKADPLDDHHLQIMLENCFKYEMSRLAKELNEM